MLILYKNARFVLQTKTSTELVYGAAEPYTFNTRQR